MALGGVLLTGSLAGMLGVGVLRYAWQQDRRSHPLNLAGWLLILTGAVLGWQAAGAWGTSVTALWTMGAALVLLAWAAFRSRPGKMRASNRRAGIIAERGEPLRLMGRVLTFIMVGLIAGILGIGIAVAGASLLLFTGAGEANAFFLALTLTPLAWAVLAHLLLMESDRRGQLRLLAFASLPLWPCLALGVLS